MPPNSVKLLKRLGVYEKVLDHPSTKGMESADVLEKIAKLATWPKKITLKRWQNGSEIAATPLMPTMEETYGNPYFLIHRGDLHKVLLDKAVEVGADIKVNSFVTTVEENGPCVKLADGTIYEADLIVGADGKHGIWCDRFQFVVDTSSGIKSRVRKAILGDDDVQIHPDPNCAYRTLIPGDLMIKDADLKPLIERPEATCWIGHEGHVMAYPIRNGALYNFVMCHPGSVGVGKPNEPASLDSMRERYKEWDPIITKLIDIVPQCLKWQNAEIEKFPSWSSPSGKVVLIGDASHGMVPYMAQGAAMAVEDGVMLAACISRARSQADLPELVKHFVEMRRDRCYAILDGARNNGAIWHLPDGPEQQRRDQGMRAGPKPAAELTEQNPNRWSDPKFQPWMFGYDASAEVSCFGFVAPGTSLC